MANSIAKVKPDPLRKVDDSADIRLRASVSAPAGSVPIIEYEIELGPLDTDPKDWGPPIWETEGFVEFDDGESEDEPDTGSIRRPRFETVDGCEAERDMVVGRNRPHVRLSAVPEAKQFRWVLNQDGVVRDRGRGRIGHSHDGRACIRILPDQPLRRSGQDWEDRIRFKPGRFFPPFTRFREGVHIRRYLAATRDGHSDFAVDFNRGGGAFDEGDAILAPAPGTVIRVDKRPDNDGGNGEVEIDHRDGWHTVYAHMRDIKVGLGPNERDVEVFDRIGTLSDVGKSSGHADSPHLHHQHLFNGQPRKMRLRGLGNLGRSTNMLTSDFAAGTRKVEGAMRPRGPAIAILSVLVRSGAEAEWSKPARLRFEVAPRDDEIGSCDDIDCEMTPGEPAIFDIKARYDGEDLSPGPYSVRYRGIDASGNPTRWAFDHSLIVGG